jgi:hypothetical protein
MTELTVIFAGPLGGALQKSAERIFEAHGGIKVSESQTVTGPKAGECEVCYDVPGYYAEIAKKAIKQAGFRLGPEK